LARCYLLLQWSVFAISTSRANGRGSMSFFVQLLEAISVLVPDFLTLGLVAPAFFSLYCIAKALGLTGTADLDSALRVSLTLAYLAPVTVNILSFVLTPARSRTTITSWSNSKTDQSGRKSLPGKLETQRVEHGGAVIES
jgi:hypothetical protein